MPNLLKYKKRKFTNVRSVPILSDSTFAEVQERENAFHPSESAPVRNEPGDVAPCRDVIPTLITEFEERWLGEDYQFSLQWSQGTALVILAAGITRSYDVPSLQRLTGLPAVFLESVTASLRRSERWLAADGYCKLVADIAAGMSDDDVDRTVAYLLQEILDVAELTACDEAWQLGMRMVV